MSKDLEVKTSELQSMKESNEKTSADQLEHIDQLKVEVANLAKDLSEKDSALTQVKKGRLKNYVAGAEMYIY